jgi:hypothetical protein
LSRSQDKFIIKFYLNWQIVKTNMTATNTVVVLNLVTWAAWQQIRCILFFCLCAIFR